MNTKSLILLVICFIAQISFSQVLWQVKSDEVKKWYYTDGDEFNKNYVDMQKWKYSPDWGSSVLKQSVYFTQGQNVNVANGKAHFITKKEDYMGHINYWEIDTMWAKKNKFKIENDKTLFKYTAGALWSQQKYKYGYFECRFKSNNEKGIWPAFWLYAGHENDEIDWFELKGERDLQAHVDVHCPSGCENYRGGFLNLKRGWGGWINLTESLSKDFNIISGEWNEDYLVWYLNGKPLCNFEYKFEYPMWLILNTSVASNNNGGFSPAPDASTKFPNEYLVDYVRIWAMADTTRTKPVDQFALSDETMKTSDPKNNSQLKKPLKFIYNKKVLGKEHGTVTFLPLTNQRYSLTFTGPDFKDAKIEIQNSAKQRVKELSLSNPNYFVLDLNDLENGNYTVVINTIGKTLIQNFKIERSIR